MIRTRLTDAMVNAMLDAERAVEVRKGVTAERREEARATIVLCLRALGQTARVRSRKQLATVLARKRAAKPDEDFYVFETSAEAWDFMRKCDADGIAAGMPSLEAPYTVRVVPTVTTK